MSKRHLSVSPSSLQTAGGGPLTLRVVKVDAEQMLVQMGVDYTLADVPERAYYADYCEVAKGRVGFSLFFGKLVPGTDRLRTKIEVTFPTDMFVLQLWGTSREVHKAIEKVAEQEKLAPIGPVEDTDKVQTFRANNVFMGSWGHEAVLDFYYVSPRDLYLLRIKPRWQATLEPVVRVVIATALLFEFLEKCRPFAEQAAPLVPQAVAGGSV
jgi:hypothetical protein